MIDHLSTYAVDFSATKLFYQKVFATLGYTIQCELESDWDDGSLGRRICAFGHNDKSTFWIIESASPSTGRHVAFKANNRQQVDAFYNAAMNAGAADNGVPGLRPEYHENYYAAFVIDPDGNDIEAVCHSG
ncbi:MAG: VOC family protein [bacterium]